MRLYHPTTLKILSERKDIPKRYSCSVWSEIFKWKASGKKHPKVFIYDDYDLGLYIKYVYNCGIKKGCNLDVDKILKLGSRVIEGWQDYNDCVLTAQLSEYFNDSYLFSDACSLYFKGVNIFEDLFPGESNKYIPVISHKEIKRQVDKYLNK